MTGLYLFEHGLVHGAWVIRSMYGFSLVLVGINLKLVEPIDTTTCSTGKVGSKKSWFLGVLTCSTGRYSLTDCWYQSIPPTGLKKKTPAVEWKLYINFYSPPISLILLSYLNFSQYLYNSLILS